MMINIIFVSLLCIFQYCIADVTIQNSEIFLNTPNVLGVYKGQDVEVRCFAAVNAELEAKDISITWILPSLPEEYQEKDRNARVLIETINLGKESKVIKLSIPNIKYQDDGEYICKGMYKNVTVATSNTRLIVQEQYGFFPAMWILIGFLILTVGAIIVIFVWEWKRPISIIEDDFEEEDEKEKPTNDVQF